MRLVADRFVEHDDGRVVDLASGERVTLTIEAAGDLTAPVSFGSTDSNVAIPDGGATPLTSTIIINHAPDFTIQDLNVRVTINHPRLSDLTVTLIAPDGTRVKLVQGATGVNLPGTTFDDESLTPITTTQPPNGTFSGFFQPFSKCCSQFSAHGRPK